jgi:predicted dehydrogenase
MGLLGNLVGEAITSGAALRFGRDILTPMAQANGAGKIRWGVLGVAAIAVKKVVPAMQQGDDTSVVAIASRSLEKARDAAGPLGIAKAYGSYEELLADPEIEAVYNPLPNHLHVPWSIRAVEAGKHVLCEKPIALTADEARTLVAARDRAGVLVQEAFMVRAHPQWLGVRDLVREGRIGELRSIHAAFSYFNRDPANVRNIAGIGGGGLLDIGCYPVTVSRFLYGEEPRRVVAVMERDPDFGTDRLTSGMMEFAAGTATFTCSTQLAAYQRVQVFGTKARIEIEIPFNAPPDRPCRVFLDDGQDPFGTGVETLTFETCDQYTLQGDLFSRAVRAGGPAPVPLEDAVANMAVLDALTRSAATGRWETPAR